MACLHSLPTELIDQIIDYLATPPPSAGRLHEPPSDCITKGVQDVKNLSLSCSRFAQITQPSLFTHSCIYVNDAHQYQEFIAQSELDHYVTSIVVRGPGNYEPNRHILQRLIVGLPALRRLILIAPPPALGEMLDLQVEPENSWAFQIPLQIMQLEVDCPKTETLAINKSSKSLFDILPWTSFWYNESSSLKAYTHYEYFLYKVPSIFRTQGQIMRPQPALNQRRVYAALARLTSFTYVAVFPFYNHLQIVLTSLDYMTSLRALKVQLGPSENDRATELEQRGSIDPSDPWMELATGYSLVAHVVRNKGALAGSPLERFAACDYQLEAVRGEIVDNIVDVLGDEAWCHDGQGTWTKTH